jgi:hypothetical protein
MDTKNYTPTDDEFEKWDRQDNTTVIITVVAAAVALLAIPIIRLRREEKALVAEHVAYNDMIHRFKYPNRQSDESKTNHP